MRIQTAPQQAIALWLPGRVIPKARPRVARGQAYLPAKYREWKQSAVLKILCQLSDHASFPLTKVAVQILLSGKHRGDLDNLSGSILDVLVQARVLTDDRLSYVPRLLVEHEPTGQTGVTIVIKEFFDDSQNHRNQN